MEEKREANMLVNVAIALFAGALSSILILALTHGFIGGDAPQEPGRAIVGEHASNTDAVPVTSQVDAGSSTDSSNKSIESLNEQFLQLQGALIEANRERAQLAASIVEMNRQLSELESSVINLASMPVNDAEALDAQTSSEAMPSDHRAGGIAGFGGGVSAERQFESLLAAGLDEQSARDLQLRSDQYQLARLELFDQSAREGWDDSEQLSERLKALDESRPDLRSELGETAYDRYLYESGRPNRVGIASIISGSAAELAGLQTGDVIFSYADERVYTVQDLQDSTRSGIRGEYVTVLLDRNGEIIRTDIQRGPMGVTLQGSRQQP